MAEGREKEVMAMRLTDPKGRVVESIDRLNGRKFVFSPPDPTSGLWSIEITKPAKGCFEDHSIDVVGIPPVFFLSREKYWCD